MKTTPLNPLSALVIIGGHALALGCCFAALAALTFDPIHFTLLQDGLQDLAIRGAVVRSLILTALGAVGVWGLTFGLYRLVARRRSTRTVRLAPTRGTILTETLIVLPVYFLFVFGLAQLTINSIAGLLSTLASYEAARTLAVWGPEVAEQRRGVSTELAVDKARVAAASVLAPVVSQSIAVECRQSRTLELHKKGLQAAGNLPSTELPKRVDSLADAFDHSRLASRGLPKLHRAYCSTEVTVDGGEVIPGRAFTARVTYEHANVMPLVSGLFGDRYVPGVGHISVYERAYEGTAQLQPNSIDPACRFCPEWGNSIL